MTKYVSGIVQRASPNVGEGRIRPAGRSLGTPGLNNKYWFKLKYYAAKTHFYIYNNDTYFI